MTLHLADFIDILRVNKGLHCFGHPADKIVLAQSLDIAALHRRNQRPILHFKQLNQIFIAKCSQEFVKIHRVKW